MSLLLALLLSLALARLMWFFALSLEREQKRAQWFLKTKKVLNEPLLVILHRPLLVWSAAQLNRFHFRVKSKRLSGLLYETGADSFFSEVEWIAFSFWLTLEVFLLASLLFGFSLSVFLSTLFLIPSMLWLWLSKKREERRNAIRKDLPMMMDLLSISVGAGLDLIQSIEKIVKLSAPSELMKEFGLILHQLKLGSTRKQAFLDFKKRVPLAEIGGFVSLLAQAFQFGTPLGPLLIATADQMRLDRLIQAEKQGVKAAQWILFPLIFCILPSVILTIFAPLGLRYLSGGLEAFL